MNKLIRILSSRPQRLAVTRPCDNCKVLENASYTPSEMQKLVSQGIPVSSQSVSESMFFDGYDTPPDVPDVNNLRGVDVVQSWETSLDAKYKLRNAHITDKQIYGDVS